MRFPTFSAPASSLQVTDTFAGYHHNLRIGAGEFYDMHNMSADDLPVLSPRKPRGVVISCSGATGVTYADTYGLVYTKGEDLWGISGKLLSLGLSDTPKQFVHFGKYVLILPDMKYFNTRWAGDYGDMGYDRSVTSGKATLSLCDADGEAYEAVVSGTTPPATDKLWLDTSETPHTLRRYSDATEDWAQVVDTCVKLTAEGIGGSGWLYPGDVVVLSGIQGAELNGAVEIRKLTANSLIFPGLLEETLTQDCVEYPIRVQRRIPVMDFVIEAGNRLWGCRYGTNSQGAVVNEIYASKLGDFRNWESFQGISTDSYVASIGTPGAFTGAVNLGGYPVFYKENFRHKVWPSATGAHQITSQPCKGVLSGCGGSVAAVPGGAIYKSEDGFCLDDGTSQIPIGDAFGAVRYHLANGHCYGDKYYVSMADEEENYHFFTYDLKKRLWHREDTLQARCFCRGWALEEERGILWDLAGQVKRTKREEAVPWMVQTGDLGLEIPRRKYLSRLTLRMSLAAGSEVSFWLCYDHEGVWQEVGSVYGTGNRTFSIPLRPRRCDHLRLMLRGKGEAKLYAIIKTLADGGEVL